ncbi:MAG: hypothetical protein EA379_09090 [Phycisphaerales bacterium]|nr:MAG: hypothetical protein EA379_09090 [Phycisphaerales bacterium]
MDRLPGSEFVDRSPEPGQGITVNGQGDGAFATQWGTWAGGGTHAFGGSTTYPDPGFPTFFVVVSSGAMPAPPGKKFAGFFEIDFTDFGAGDFPNHEIDFIGIKDPTGNNFINSVTVIGAGSATTDGYSINWQGLGADIGGLGGNPIVRIEWSQIPAPGAAAMLGLAGLAGIRRRR